MDNAQNKGVARRNPLGGAPGQTRLPRGVPVLPTLLKKGIKVKHLYKTLQYFRPWCMLAVVFFRESKRIRQLEDDLRETMGEVKALRLEWDETYDKLLKLYRKTSFNRARLEKLEQDSPEPPVTAQEGSPENGHSAGGFLSPKQRLIQQQILQRRAASR